MKLLLSCSLLIVATGCTTLGPMPAMTGSTGAAEPRPGIEVQGAAVPGFFLSSATSEDPAGGPSGQAAVWLDGGQLVGAPGLAVGGRLITGGDEAPYPEPMVRYRAGLDDDNRLALTAAAFGTSVSGAAVGASYSATRLGGEVSLNGRLTPRSQWAELHAFAGVSTLALFASGTYCSTAAGTGTDCQDDGNDRVISGEFSGAYPAGFVGLGLDLARHLELPLHGMRAEVMMAGGVMPEVRDGSQTGRSVWSSLGLGLTFRGGASSETK